MGIFLFLFDVASRIHRELCCTVDVYVRNYGYDFVCFDVAKMSNVFFLKNNVLLPPSIIIEVHIFELQSCQELSKRERVFDIGFTSYHGSTGGIFIILNTIIWAYLAHAT
jgi:hypothetical protein